MRKNAPKTACKRRKRGRLKRLLRLSAALLVMAAGCREIETVKCYAISPDGSRIAFIRGEALFVEELEAGARPVALEKSSVDGEGLAWSPDGRRLVYSRHIHGKGRVYELMEWDRQRREARTLSQAVAKETAPAYDGSATRVIFRSFRGGMPDLWVLDLENNRLRQLTADDACETAVSPSAAQDLVAYVSLSSTGSRVFLADLESFARLELVAAWDRPVCAGFSPDGKSLLVESTSGALWIAEGPWDFSAQRAQIRPRRLDFGQWARWTPDGSAVVFVRDKRVWRKPLRWFSAQPLTAGGTIKVLPAQIPGNGGFLYLTDEAQNEADFRSSLISVAPRQGSRRFLFPEPLEPELLARAAKAAELEGRLDEAVALLSEVEDSAGAAGEKARIAHERAGLEMRRGRYERSCEIYKRIGMNLEAARVAFERLEDVAAARDILMKTPAPSPGPDALFYAVVTGENPEALRPLARALRLRSQGKAADAARILLDLLGRRPGQAARLLAAGTLAEIYLEDLRRPVRALEVLDAAGAPPERFALGPSFLLLKARALKAMGQAEQSVKEYAKVLSARPGDPASAGRAFDEGLETALASGQTELIDAFAETARARPLGDAEQNERALGGLLVRMDRVGLNEEANRVAFALMDAWGIRKLAGTDLLRWLGKEGTKTIIEWRLTDCPPWFRERLSGLLERIDLGEGGAQIRVFALAVLRLRKAGEVEAAWRLFERGSDLLGRRSEGERPGDKWEFLLRYILANMYLNESNAEKCLENLSALGPLTPRKDLYARQAASMLSQIAQAGAFRETDSLAALQYLRMERRLGLDVWQESSALAWFLESGGKTGLEDAFDDFAASRCVGAEIELKRYLNGTAPVWLAEQARYWLAVCRTSARHGEIKRAERAVADARFLTARENAFVETWALMWSFMAQYPRSALFIDAYRALMDSCSQFQAGNPALRLSFEALQLARDAGRSKETIAQLLSGAGGVLRNSLDRQQEALPYFLNIYENFRGTSVWADSTAQAVKDLSKPLLTTLQALTGPEREEGIGRLRKTISIVQELRRAAPDHEWVKSGEAQYLEARLVRMLALLGENAAQKRAEDLYVDLFTRYSRFTSPESDPLLFDALDEISDEGLEVLLAARPDILKKKDVLAADPQKAKTYRWQIERIERVLSASASRPATIRAK